ncbi:MAG: restriction endonuclease, partial [Clostridia bacterium]
VTLETFDTIIPDDVFKDVTSISLTQFRFLRDGGPYTDPATGEEKTFGGRLFDPVVFDDSVREFMRLRVKLANYFDPSNKEDIFDYIPAQRTNQIFTPKWVVQKMVDMLEQENPGCFDHPDKTFADLYMKSGLYITEIVKRLYNSPAMKQLFPDGKERLRHIFAKQVYGLAPTEIIYQIAIAYILGFAENTGIEKNNFRMLDALPYAKEGTLASKLDEVFANVE